jgi:hypothetical protein
MPARRSTIAELDAKVRDLLAIEGGHGRDHEQWQEWVVTYGAIELLGELTPWEAAAIEWIVKRSGTYVYEWCGDPLPGIPKQWLCQGGPNGDDDRLKVKGGKALDMRISPLLAKLEAMKKRGVKFRIRQLPKSQYAGIAALETQAITPPRSMQMPKRDATARDVFRPYRA